MSLIRAVLENPHAPAEARQAALDRIHRSPGLPAPASRSTPSFWLRDPHPTVARARSEALPATADVVIIGSGITGLSVAWTLLQHEGVGGGDGREARAAAAAAPPSVVMVEARDACSGATGRNGGHVLETVVGEYGEFKRLFGREAAAKLTRFRLGHLPAMEELLAARPEVRKHSQLRKVEFISVYFDEEAFRDVEEDLAEFKRDMPEESSGFAAHRGEKLTKDFGLSEYAVGAITGPAGAVWPYRLVTDLLAELQRDFPSRFRIETNTPVSDISTDDEPLPYRLTTPRGALRARHLVHCTNGHVGHLVPGFHGRVFPLRGQMSAQAPGARLPDRSHAHSWLVNYHDGGFDYLTQLPTRAAVSADDGSSSGSGSGSGSDGEMMLGGGLAAARAHGLEEVGVAADDALDLYADIHLSGALPAAVFGRANWGGGSAAGGVKAMWTGIMGFSADGLPWVGELPASLTGRRRRREVGGGAGEGAAAAEWAAVGYSGEGMVHAWLSGKAVATMLLARLGIVPAAAAEEMREWFPEQLGITEERIRSAVIQRTVPKL